MKNIKTILLAMLMGFMLTVSPVASANQGDAALLFGADNAQSVQLEQLSDAEMVATEGEISGVLAHIAKLLIKAANSLKCK